jgi:hypothetical protein
LELGQKFYDFLMNFRKAYGMEFYINHWRQKYEAERESVFEKQRTIQDLTDTIRWRDARIKELETDYIKKLEGEIQMAKAVIRMARERALIDAELLTIPA